MFCRGWSPSCLHSSPPPCRPRMPVTLNMKTCMPAWWVGVLKETAFTSTLGAIVSLETTIGSHIGTDNTAIVSIDFLKTLASACVQVWPQGSHPRHSRGRIWNQEGSRQQWVQCFLSAGPQGRRINFKRICCYSLFVISHKKSTSLLHFSSSTS